MPGDRPDAWLAPTLAAQLLSVGWTTLARLRDAVARRPGRWHRGVAGLGTRRGAALEAWLRDAGADWPDSPHLPDIAVRTPGAITVGPSAADVVWSAARLEQWPIAPSLAGASGSPGRFATRMANHLGAADDRQALLAWLAVRAGNPITQRAYRKEVERFYAWCLWSRGVALSSVDARDCLAYREFLAAVPAAWRCPTGTPRHASQWRPFRGQLAASSQKYALVVVQTLFDGLREANYVVGNPMAAVNKQLATRQGGIDRRRAFTAAEWDYLVRRAREAAERSAAAVDRRLLLALLLFVGTGLRLSELTCSTEAALEHVDFAQAGESAEVVLMLRVLGKGGKLREIPVPEAVGELLQTHWRDAESFGPLARPRPLICTLADAPARTNSPADRALGASGLYRAIKRFFKRCADVGTSNADAEVQRRLASASPHWMRHTFARRGAVAGVPVEVLQQALGHASLTTTTVYLTTEQRRMVRELRRVS